MSISTEEQGETDIVVHAIDALQDHRLRVLVTAPGRSEELRLWFPNVRVEEFVPHDQVLAHSRLFITHAGHGSVMRGLTHGVPMVLVPWSRDQPGVAHRAERLGVGITVDRDGLSAASMRSAVQHVVDDTTMADTARQVAERLRYEDPVESTCILLERAAATGSRR